MCPGYDIFLCQKAQVLKLLCYKPMLLPLLFTSSGYCICQYHHPSHQPRLHRLPMSQTQPFHLLTNMTSLLYQPGQKSKLWYYITSSDWCIWPCHKHRYLPRHMSKPCHRLLHLLNDNICLCYKLRLWPLSAHISSRHCHVSHSKPRGWHMILTSAYIVNTH